MYKIELMELTTREKLILQEIVNDYIASAAPVSSQSLAKNPKFHLSSASLRIAMQKLTEKGYLYQPYTAGGRIPTDKSYRFFVDNIFRHPHFSFRRRNAFQTLCVNLKGLHNTLKLSREVTKITARFSSDLAINYLEETEIFWREGWETITKQPEFQDSEYLKKFIKVINEFEQNITKFQLSDNKQIKVYIGKEIPFKEKEFSMIIAKNAYPLKQQSILAILGPKRMNFAKNISLLHCLIETLEKI